MNKSHNTDLYADNLRYAIGKFEWVKFRSDTDLNADFPLCLNRLVMLKRQ